MKREELREILDLVKNKLCSDVDAACGFFWPDNSPATRYAVNEEDATTFYAVGEEDVTDRYGVAD